MFDKLGRLAAKRRKGVLALFLLGIIVAGAIGGMAFSRFDSGGYSDPNSDSAQVTTYLKDTFNLKEPSLVLAVNARGKSIDDPAIAASAGELESKLRNEPNTERVVSYWSAGGAPFLKSKDGQSGMMFVYFRTTDFTES